MSLDATRWAWMQRDLRPLHKLILLALADRAGADDKAFPSQDQLIADTGAERKTVWQGLKALQEKALILDSGERRGNTGQVVVWQLVGVEHRQLKDSENGTLKPVRKRKDSENGRIPKTDLKDSENGRVKHSENGIRNLSGNLSGNQYPPSAHAQSETATPNDGMPSCIPRAEWEAFRQEQAHNGKPLSIGQMLACWQELAAADAAGYDPAAMLRRATAGGFRTFDRRAETKKAPEASTPTPGLSNQQRGNYGPRIEIDNSAPAKCRRAIAKRQIERGEVPDFDPVTGDPYRGPGAATGSAAGGIGGGSADGGDVGGDVIDLGPADYRKAH